ncbi:MAG: energy transducer TonB [Pseudomonadota bacterium]
MSVAVNAFAYQEPGKIPSIALAVMVHVLLAVFLFFGVRWQSSQPEAVMVELWDSPPAPAVEKVVAQPPPKPEVKPEPRVEKAVEPPKPDIALEKKKVVKKAPPKQEEPKHVEPKQEPEPKLNLDRSEDIQAQLERETAALEEQLEKNRILEQMRREAATFAAQADAAYIGKLKGKIKSNIVLPPDIRGNPEAIFDVVQLPTGEVISVKLRKSSGHKAYDEAVERAILKASPLPKPDRPEQFQRNLAITFRPLD